MSDEALLSRVNDVDVFSEVEPNQKERIILSLRKSGNIVGYMGDGINDASALHAADVGISVDSAVDVEASMIVLIIRSRRPFFKSTPGRYLLIATLLVGGVTLILPYISFSALFGFQPLPSSFLFVLGVIITLYIAAAEIVKQFFYKKVKF